MSDKEENEMTIIVLYMTVGPPGIGFGRVESVQVYGGQLRDDGAVRDRGRHPVHGRASSLVRGRILNKLSNSQMLDNIIVRFCFLFFVTKS